MQLICPRNTGLCGHLATQGDKTVRLVKALGVVRMGIIITDSYVMVFLARDSQAHSAALME